MTIQKVVITGGAGFIGANLAAELLKIADEVHVVDDLSSGDRTSVPDHADFHQFDIRDEERLFKVMSGAQVVFHLAGLCSVPLSFEHPIKVNSINVQGTLTVLEVSRRLGVRRVIYSSSSAVYGELNVERAHEDLPVAPLSPYGLSKYQGELLASLYYRAYGLETVSLRYFNVYGPLRDKVGPNATAIARFHEATCTSKPLQVIGDGLQTRDFIMVDDVVSANISAALSPNVGAGEVVNVGTGVAVRILDLARQFRGEIEFVAPRSEIRNSCADISRARNLLAFAPTFTLSEGLRYCGYC
jgi:UDP-glucose 4-epimerase